MGIATACSESPLYSYLRKQEAVCPLPRYQSLCHGSVEGFSVGQELRVRFEVLTTATMKMLSFRDVTPYCPIAR